MRKKIYPILAAVALLTIVLIIIAADRGVLSPFLTALYRFPQGDKVGHFLLMGMLAFFIALAAPPRRVSTWLVVLSVGITLEELSQMLFPTRNFSWFDLLFSLLGVATFGWLGARLTRRKTSEND